MSNKGLWLFWVDVANAVLMLALAGTGVVLRWVLPPGSGSHGGRGGGFRGGRGPVLEFLDLTRHEWGDVHFWLSVLLALGVGIHLAQHWGWISTVVSRLLQTGRTSRSRQIRDSHLGRPQA